VGLCLDPYGGPGGGALSYEPGTPVSHLHHGTLAVAMSVYVCRALCRLWLTQRECRLIPAHIHREASHREHLAKHAPKATTEAEAALRGHLITPGGTVDWRRVVEAPTARRTPCGRITACKGFGLQRGFPLGNSVNCRFL
jgi:hypothetical protein